MKALSIIQPWAYLIATGEKDIENRTWKPSPKMIGQRIVIHASKKRSKQDFHSANMIANPPVSMYLTVYGAAIGTAIISDIVEESLSPWFFGPVGIVLRDAELWETPVYCNGALGFWEYKERIDK